MFEISHHNLISMTLYSLQQCFKILGAITFHFSHSNNVSKYSWKQCFKILTATILQNTHGNHISIILYIWQQCFKILGAITFNFSHGNNVSKYSWQSHFNNNIIHIATMFQNIHGNHISIYSWQRCLQILMVVTFQYTRGNYVSN